MLVEYLWTNPLTLTEDPSPASWPPKPTVECEKCKVIMPNNVDRMQPCSGCGKDMAVDIGKKRGADV